MALETDRSRILTYQACHRKRFLGYHAFGKGLEKKSKSLALSAGSAFHEGAAVLLMGGGIEVAVGAAIGAIEEAFDQRAIELEEATPEQAAQWDYAKGEQGALVEGLLRAWEFYCGAEFKERFETLEVESEGRATLCDDASGETNPAADGYEAEPLVLMFRPDAVVRERVSGDCFLISWKTCSSFGKMTINQARTDHQSISEVWGWLNRDGGHPTESVEEWGKQAHIEGVVYIFCCKGKRQRDDYLGLWLQDSPLIYGWKKLGDSPEETEWSFRYSWTDEAEINIKTGKPVGHKLGKGWQKVPIWRDYPGGVKQWIADLGARRVNPRHFDPFESIFPQSMPVERRRDEVESWKRQVVVQEMEVAAKVAAIGPTPTRGQLDEYFPQYSSACYSYNSPCPFQAVCWEGAAAEPGELFQLRVANHPSEGKGDEGE